MAALVSCTSQPYVPGKHFWSEAEENRGVPCNVDITRALHHFGFFDANQTYPEWVPVEKDHPTQVLEGTVTPGPDLDSDDWPHVSNEDWPTDHYTHDFTFHVIPDYTADHRYLNLLGYQSITSPCAEKRAQLDDLNRSLQGLGTGDGLSPNEKKEQKQEVQEWHRQHDAEVRRLTRELQSGKCRSVITDKDRQQPSIEVEWETGLGASNDIVPPIGNFPGVPNLLAPNNRQGESGGFYSAGHSRRQIIWAWPTIGDHVHVEGSWIWDRGHPPGQTEIHPARLVAVNRMLPVAVDPCRKSRERLSKLQADLHSLQTGVLGYKCQQQEAVCDRKEQALKNWHTAHDQEFKDLTAYIASGKCRMTLANRSDVFASGDGGALSNNRGIYPFVTAVRMNSRDYSYSMPILLPPPSPTAQLDWYVEKHEGDTFPGEPEITPIDGSYPKAIRVVIPWHSRNVDNRAVFARTIHLYWNEPPGVPHDYDGKAIRVILHQVTVNDTHDTTDGEYRIFIEVGGQWVFANEFQDVNDILNDGIGDTGKQAWPIDQTFLIYLPVGAMIRVHAGGWEADGINNVIGNIHDPNSACNEDLSDWLNDNVFTFFGVGTNGCNDDPIGEINTSFIIEDGSLQDTPKLRDQVKQGDSYSEPSHGHFKSDEGVCSGTQPRASYYLDYVARDVAAQRFWRQ